MSSWICGLLVVATLCQFGIDESDGVPCFKFWETRRVASSNSKSNFYDWFWQILGQNPATTSSPEMNEPGLCPPCKCGLTTTMKRIVGGVETKVNEYSWMAQLRGNGIFHCGASVISDRYLLTASHCVHRMPKDKLTVRIGDHDRASDTETVTKDYKVEQVIMHKDYSSYRYDNDIALVRIKGIIKFNDRMRPVCLADKGLTYSGKMGKVVGWGATSMAGSTSNKLLEVRVPIISNNECRSTRYGPSRITDNMMCAGYSEGGKDSCQGDSGGPMHVVDPKSRIHKIVGIVSWGEGCAQRDFPGVYTRVNRYLTWIKKHSPDACSCS